MSLVVFAGARARTHLLALLLATTALYPLGAKAQQATELPAVDASAKPEKAKPAPALAPALALSPVTLFFEKPAGQAETTIPQSVIQDSAARSVMDVLRYSPGVTLKQGNGPRDIGISIRGSGARVGFGIRNIVIFEDGFPVTQPDGLSRGDLIDPRAYGAIDVIRGPSSALFGNYATGGAINFQLMKAADINGIEVGADAGSFGYLNNYLRYGKVSGDFDISLFASNTIGNGPTNHNLYNTQTINLLAHYRPTPNDVFTVKVINNTLYNDLSFRLSLNQFYANPFQYNCYGFGSAALAATQGCQTNNFFLNGYRGASYALTPYQSGAHRNDRRSIVGLRWEHEFSNSMLWRVQAVFDDKDIKQPTGATAAIGDEPAFNFLTDLTARGTLFNFDSLTYFAAFFNAESQTSYTYNVGNGGNGAVAGVTQITPSSQQNMGIRGREEVKLTDQLTAVAGFGAEYTKILGTLNSYTYPSPAAFAVPSIASTIANQSYYNIAPEASLIYQPNSEWLVKARVGTGYGTPQAGNLFVLPSGLPGNNTNLKSQTNLGYDLAAVWTPSPNLRLSVGGFYEFFRNELVSQTPGPSPLQSFQFNAPRSEHRGVEVSGNYAFLDGWSARLAYTYNNQIYTEYTENLNKPAGGAGNPAGLRSFNRAGKWIPGVPPNEFTIRAGYDFQSGPLQGLGAYAEYLLTDTFYLDNANLLKIPGYQIVNLNLHYDKTLQDSFFQSIGAYVEVKNIFEDTYISGANTITNTLGPNGAQNAGNFPRCVTGSSTNALSCSTGTIYAGFPRIIQGGLRIKF